MTSIFTDAQLAQRDASRRLYFVSAGCLYHPQAHLVLDADETMRIALEQSMDAALQFAELSDAESRAFRDRAVAETRVVARPDGSHLFEQKERKARRRWRRPGLLHALSSTPPDMVAPPERRGELWWRTAFLRLMGVLAAAAFIVWGVRIVREGIAAFAAAGASAETFATAALGGLIGGFGAVLMYRLLQPLRPGGDFR